jgi:hypothetical protein
VRKCNREWRVKKSERLRFLMSDRRQGLMLPVWGIIGILPTCIAPSPPQQRNEPEPETEPGDIVLKVVRERRNEPENAAD